MCIGAGVSFGRDVNQFKVEEEDCCNPAVDTMLSAGVKRVP